MSTYEFVAGNAAQEFRRGTLEALDAAHAEEALAKEGYRVLLLKERNQASLRGLDLRQLFPSLFGIKGGEVITFTRNLSTLVGSGMGVLEALQILQEQAGRPEMQRLIGQLIRDLSAGTSLANSLSRHPKLFNTVYTRVVATAEETGALDRALDDLATSMEEQAAIRRKLGQAMMVPAIALAVGAVVLAVLFTVTLPQLMTLFDSFDVDLPLPTRVLIGSVGFFGAHKFQIMLLGTLIVAAGIAYVRSRPGRRQFHRMLLRTPFLGPVLLTTDLSRFLSALGQLLHGGTALPDAVELASQTVANTELREAFAEAREKALRGHGIAAPLRERKVLPSMLGHLLKTGEETGTLDQAATRLANYYKRQAEEKTRALVGLLEPALTLALAAAVGFISISIIMPIYSMLGKVGDATGA